MGNGQGKKIQLKEKSKRGSPTDGKHPRTLDDVEEVQEYNEHVANEPFQTELINLNELNCYTTCMGGIPAESLGDVAFLAGEVIAADSLEERDEPWEFKTLKNEIAAVISKIYEEK